MDTPTILTAPLTHAQRQFRQNCLFMFNGAVFLSTPSVLTDVEVAIQLTGGPLIVLDSTGDPVVLESSKMTDFRDEILRVLRSATEVYLKARADAEAQFVQLLTVTETPDEETE